MKPEGETYVIELDEMTHISTRISVKILDIGSERIYGKIVDQGELLYEGDRVRANVFFKKSHAKTESGCQIHLNKESIASGVATIEINELNESSVSGSIIEHHSVPDPGDTIRAKIGTNRKIARPLTKRYEIYLKPGSNISGKVIVEIISVSDKIYEKVMKRSSKKEYSIGSQGQKNSKNDLISRGKL